ncbi:E3 ubiquitin-protein ligase RING1-like [Arachis stenosperma]|uniref:E3 ubiquitin-protein ligase RING1-like n=1 Tax=Arachis stenosperma TaxID=217475 RepID=UPI0025AB67BE|nr:E3 ubiquitin-protein ligase RING1-like [Arachis stenosperma]
MSLTGRPRVIVNGVRRTRSFHCFWCLNCQRTVRIPATYPNGSLCPYCFNRLRYELDITRPTRFLFTNNNNLEPSPASQLLNGLALILHPPQHNHNRWEGEEEQTLENQQDPRAWITLRFVRPNNNGPQRLMPPPLQPQPQANNNSDPIDEFIQNLVENNNNRPGPPPASSSAIAALPVVRLAREQLASDPNCAICKDEFEVDGEVRELPCKHFYHCDCILPWLRIHNTCPVCRYELPPVAASENQNNNHNHNINNNEQQSFISFNWILRQIASISSPLRAILDYWTHRHYSNHQDNNAPAHDDGGTISSWWRELFIL